MKPDVHCAFDVHDAVQWPEMLHVSPDPHGDLDEQDAAHSPVGASHAYPVLQLVAVHGGRQPPPFDRGAQTFPPWQSAEAVQVWTHVLSGVPLAFANAPATQTAPPGQSEFEAHVDEQ